MQQKVKSKTVILCTVIGCFLLVLLAGLVWHRGAFFPQPQESLTATQATTMPETLQPTFQTGWQDQEEGAVYILSDGSRATGWLQEGGKRYYFNDSGILQTGWMDHDQNRYYLAEDGAAVTGWLTLEQQTFYFREDGTMARGMVEIGGEKHYFTSQGHPILLANPWNFIPADYDPVLAELPQDIGPGRWVVAGDCYDQVVAMVSACNAAMREQYGDWGAKVPKALVIAGYRARIDQVNAFEDKVKRVMKADPSLTREEAEVVAGREVAYPDTSEHQLGLAVDIIDTNLWLLEPPQAEMEAQQWLMAHCWEYGFILRYPEGKTDSTGIVYEPWHYRYVGLEAAREIMESGVTLEQYLDGLS